MAYKCDRCGKLTDNDQINIHVSNSCICDNCLKQLDRKIKWKLENEHWREDIIICPYCDCEYYTSLYDEEGYYTVKCPSCKKKFNLEVEEVRHFSTQRNIDEMPEYWDTVEE